jgi:hypothetical protein
MNHEELRRRLSAYLEADLAAGERARIEEHLAGCPECRREYLELRHTVDLLRGLLEPEPPLDLAGRVIARLREGEGRPGVVARCRVRVSRIVDLPWLRPMATVALALGALAILRGLDLPLEIPGSRRSGVTPRSEIAAERSAGRPFRASRSVGSAAKPGSSEAVPPLLACLRAGGPARPELGPGDPCEHWDSWMVGLGMHDAPAFVVEVEAVPPPARERVLGRIGDFATRSGSAPLLAGTLRSAGDPRATRLANRIERISALSTR